MFKRWTNGVNASYLPYKIKSIELESFDEPIVLLGDQMSWHWSKTLFEFQNTVSKDLTNPIKVKNLAHRNYGIHRSLEQVKAFKKVPPIWIYHGGSQEWFEKNFELSEKDQIKQNFRYYKNDLLQSLLTLYPIAARLVYEPIKLAPIPAQLPTREIDFDSQEYLAHLELKLMIFELGLEELVRYAQEKNALLLLITLPVHLDLKPQKTCDFLRDQSVESELNTIRELVKAGDIKSAYSKANLLYENHHEISEVAYLFGQIAKNRNQNEQAYQALIKASQTDCDANRVNEVYNQIIKRVATKHQIMLFDFNHLLYAHWPEEKLFLDPIFPQEIYYLKAQKQVGQLIKKILKL